MSSEITADSKQDEVRQRVRRVRRACHLAQGPIAARANLDTSTLCRWELGQVTLSPKQIESIQASLLAEIAGRLRAIKRSSQFQFKEERPPSPNRCAASGKNMNSSERSTNDPNPQVSTPETNARTSSVILTEAITTAEKLASLIDEAADVSQSSYHTNRLRRLALGLVVLRDPLILAAGCRGQEVQP